MSVVDVVDKYGSSFLETLEGFSLWGAVGSGIRGAVSGLVDLLGAGAVFAADSANSWVMLPVYLCVGVVLWDRFLRL